MPHLSTRVLQGLLTLLLTLFGLLLVTFALSAFSPVDRVLQIVGDHASQSTYDQVRHQLGLDRPLPVQFWHYLLSLAHGDLGTASATGQPVLQDLLHAFPATLELATGVNHRVRARRDGRGSVRPLRRFAARFIHQNAHPARQLGADFLAWPADAGPVLREAAVERGPRQA